jgi:UDP-N-acetylglucosamine 2-epimerase
MIKKVCVITSTRADFGLLRWLMQDIQKSGNFKTPSCSNWNAPLPRIWLNL